MGLERADAGQLREPILTRRAASRGGESGAPQGVAEREESEGGQPVVLAMARGPVADATGARQAARLRSSSRDKAISVSWARFDGLRFRRQKHCSSTKTMNSVSVKFTTAVGSCL